MFENKGLHVARTTFLVLYHERGYSCIIWIKLPKTKFELYRFIDVNFRKNKII
jgi:hypothetical protein